MRRLFTPNTVDAWVASAALMLGIAGVLFASMPA